MDWLDKLAVLGFLSSIILWRGLNFFEHRQWWTLIFGLSILFVRVQIFILILMVSSLSRAIFRATGIANEGGIYFLIIECIVVGLVGLEVEHLRLSQDYLRLRWKAWTGPSRTGISPAFVPYIGDQNDWASMSSTVDLTLHDVEKYASLVSRSGRGILTDPTEILKARATADRQTNSVWVPRSQQKPGVYHPMTADEPVSLLWGEHLGFRRRCSRGIISMPKPLLSTWPKIGVGLEGNAICLAHGILARNKGLQPVRLICNLEHKNSFRAFEEGSIFWPRPGKTLRSLFKTEFTQSYSLLGPSYIIAATELALLLVDIKTEIIEDWLNLNMEHQDIELNNTIAAMASEEDFLRLYRGQYAAMLVSLSVHRIGIRLRPELLVFNATCRLEAADPPFWMESEDMQARIDDERQQLGSTVDGLVEAII